MTEAEWLTTSDFPAMMIFLRGALTDEEKEKKTGLSSRGRILAPGRAQRTTPGRLRAFALACLPRWRELPLDERSRGIINTYEEFLTGGIAHDVHADKALALLNTLSAESQSWFHALSVKWDDTPAGVSHMTWNLGASYSAYVARDEIARANETASEDDRFAWGFFGYDEIPLWRESHKNIIDCFPPLLRETVGNLFRPVTFSPAWRTDTAVTLAQQMYESRDFGAMPILADALQDAGCDSDNILDHCRGEGVHVRGCWVVDLVLGKE